MLLKKNLDTHIISTFLYVTVKLIKLTKEKRRGNRQKKLIGKPNNKDSRHTSNMVIDFVMNLKDKNGELSDK